MAFPAICETVSQSVLETMTNQGLLTLRYPRLAHLSISNRIGIWPGISDHHLDFPKLAAL